MSEEFDTNSADTDMSEEILSTTDNSIQENEENIILIWFNPVVNTTNDNEQTKQDLQAVHNLIRCPTDIVSFNAVIKSRKKEKIFLIVSATDVCALPREIIKLPELDSIFIFPEDEGEQLHDRYSKIVSNCRNADDLIKSIKENIKRVNREMEVISFYDEHEQSTRDLSKQSTEFLW
jgi:alpha-N-acetylglucosamine transferase